MTDENNPTPVSKLVGEAGSMPGTGGFTMAVFKASEVPIGTKLYTLLDAADEADLNDGMGTGSEENLREITKKSLPDSLVEAAANAILARVPLGYGMLNAEARAYAVAAIDYYRTATPCSSLSGCPHCSGTGDVSERGRIEEYLACSGTGESFGLRSQMAYIAAYDLKELEGYSHDRLQDWAKAIVKRANRALALNPMPAPIPEGGADA